MRKVEVKDIEKELLALINPRNEGCIYCVHDKPLVFKSKEGEINEEYCRANVIDICNSFNMGGIIVANTGDINMAIMKDEGWDVGKDLLNDLAVELVKFIPNIKVDNNDLIVDDKYKVISYASINANNRLIYTCVHISMNPNINHISNVCMKPMVKVPKGLTEFGITREEILEILSKILD